MKIMRDSKAQSTLEYLLVLGAIAGVFIWAAGTIIKPAVNKTLSDANKTLSGAASKLNATSF